MYSYAKVYWWGPVYADLLPTTIIYWPRFCNNNVHTACYPTCGLRLAYQMQLRCILLTFLLMFAFSFTCHTPSNVPGISEATMEHMLLFVLSMLQSSDLLTNFREFMAMEWNGLDSNYLVSWWTHTLRCQ